MTKHSFLDLTLETLIVKWCDKFLKRSSNQLLQLSFIALNNDQKITCGLLKSLVVLVFVYFTFSVEEVLVALSYKR